VSHASIIVRRGPVAVSKHTYISQSRLILRWNLSGLISLAEIRGNGYNSRVPVVTIDLVPAAPAVPGQDVALQTLTAIVL
jgi:hypothetical protein